MFRSVCSLSGDPALSQRLTLYYVEILGSFSQHPSFHLTATVLPFPHLFFHLVVLSGGLDGSFLVRKLEEMTVQARSSLLDSNGLVATSQPAKTDNIPLMANASPSETPVTVTATTNETSVTGGIVDQKESPPSKGVSVKKRKSNDKSKKGRRLGSGPIRSSLVAIAKKGIVESKVSGSGDDGSERRAEFGSSTLEADAKKAAEVLREAETVEKLRWADEVSAAATAAVAAAVKAKEEEAKAKERSKTERELLPQQEDGDGSRGEGMEPPEQDGSGEEGEIIEAVNAKAKVASASVADESSVIPKDSGKNGEENDETGEEPRTGVPPTKIELASEGKGESTVKSSLPRYTCSSQLAIESRCLEIPPLFATKHFITSVSPAVMPAMCR